MQRLLEEMKRIGKGSDKEYVRKMYKDAHDAIVNGLGNIEQITKEDELRRLGGRDGIVKAMLRAQMPVSVGVEKIKQLCPISEWLTVEAISRIRERRDRYLNEQGQRMDMGEDEDLNQAILDDERKKGYYDGNNGKENGRKLPGRPLTGYVKPPSVTPDSHPLDPTFNPKKRWAGTITKLELQELRVLLPLPFRLPQMGLAGSH